MPYVVANFASVRSPQIASSATLGTGEKRPKNVR
ncbi:iron only hydrogenase large subunit-like protein [Sphingomonas sp. BE270]|jgi:hypothetical protein|nr:iron only hydrogenase large subunit-like protein [Sphingomonas sp. BE270]